MHQKSGSRSPACQKNLRASPFPFFAPSRFPRITARFQRRSGRRGPCPSFTSRLGELRFRPSPLQADERCDAGADQPNGAGSSWPASRPPGGRLAHCGLRSPPGMEDLYDKPFPTTLIGNSLNQCYRNIKDRNRILHSRSSRISPWGETACLVGTPNAKGRGFVPRPSSCPTGSLTTSEAASCRCRPAREVRSRAARRRREWGRGRW